NRVGAFATLKDPDSLTAIAITNRVKERDTLGTVINTDSILSLYPDYQKVQLISTAKNTTVNILTTIQGKKKELQVKYKIYRLHILSLHKKYALALSCIILFFVGAPLGAIIRKGGLGLPMVIAIILFLTYYFIGVFAGNYAKEGNIHTIIESWLSTFIMLTLGVFITIYLFQYVYYIGVFGENYAMEGNIHPIIGACLPTLIMLPLGVFLTRRAT